MHQQLLNFILSEESHSADVCLHTLIMGYQNNFSVVYIWSTEPHQENETRSVSYNGGEKIIVILY